MTTSPILRISTVGAWAAITALAHYTWLAPVAAPLEVGKTATVRIGHGHKFPQSEEAINASQIDLFAIAPSGAKVKLEAAVDGNAVTAPYAVKEAGLHRIAFVQDRGVTSRTPRGVKAGGRDKNPDATQAYRTLRTAVAYCGASGIAATGGKPLGLEIELTGEMSGGAWKLRLMKQGQPAADAPIEVFLAGATRAVAAGKTGPDGRLGYQAPAGAKGPALFFVSLKDPAPAGAKYDSAQYETSLYVTW